MMLNCSESIGKLFSHISLLLSHPLQREISNYNHILNQPRYNISDLSRSSNG